MWFYLVPTFVSVNWSVLSVNTACLCRCSLYGVHLISFPTFIVWALLLIVYTWNPNPLWSNLLRLQCTCCTVPITSGRPHGSPLVWACQWPFISSIVSELWDKPNVTGNNVYIIGRLRSCPDVHLGQIVCDKDGVVDWCIVLVEMPLTRVEEFWSLPTESLPGLP